jgi:hypothetical protein
MRKAINEQFPGIPVGLCQFHISRAIEAKTRVAFKKTEDLTEDDILEQRTAVKYFWQRVRASPTKFRIEILSLSVLNTNLDFRSFLPQIQRNAKKKYRN